MSLEGFGTIAERVRRSTVQVMSGRHGQGSGIIIKSDGVIVTNAHVVGRPPVSVRLWDGSSFSAQIESRNARRDLAVLRIPTQGLAPAALGDSDRLRVGELVMAVGNPLGFVGAVTTGIVHAIGRRPGLGPTQWIQAEVQLAPGNSGGPLVDTRGEVIGINSMVVGGLGLAVPSNAVARLLAGDLQQASLGVVIQPVAIQIAGTDRLGLAVLEVVKGGAAEFASLRMGDILVGIDGQPLLSLDDLESALEGSEERVTRLQFLRGDQNQMRSVAVRLSPHAAAVA